MWRAHEGSEEVEDGVGGDGEEGEGVKAVERVNSAVVEPRHTAHHHMTGRVTSPLHHHEYIYIVYYVQHCSSGEGQGVVMVTSTSIDSSRESHSTHH